MDCFDYREFLAFAISCLSVCHMARDFQHCGFQHFKMEKLTSEAGTLKEFCETLTGLKYPLAQLASFIDKGPINRHRKGNVSTDPRLIYSSWPLWKQDMAIVMIPKGVLDKFEEEGYDVEMLRGNLITQQTQDPNIRVSSLADRLEAMDHDHPLLAALKRRPRTEGQVGKENRGRAHIIRLWRGLGRLLGTPRPLCI